MTSGEVRKRWRGCSRYALCAAALLLFITQSTGAQQSVRQPTVTLTPAPAIRLSGSVDSNSPAVWLVRAGRPELRVLTSSAGFTRVAAGTNLSRLGASRPVAWTLHPGEGVWIESVIVDEVGVWYGFYHNEWPARACERPELVLPRIGLATSIDGGLTWQDLGAILEAPRGGEVCETQNRYFVGGVGDVTVMLDRDSKYLYLFFSQYSRGADAQGVGQARLLWAARDEAVGRVEVWSDGAWLPPSRSEAESNASEPVAQVPWEYVSGTSLFPVVSAWHQVGQGPDVFWGPSVHWNSHLQMYVMLMNRATDASWRQGGVYVSFSPVLDNPRAWSTPERVITGGAWYAQVMGLEDGIGTDRTAGARARLFQGGVSNYYIDFSFR